MKGKLAAGSVASAVKKLTREKRLTPSGSMETAKQELADFTAEYKKA